MPRGFIWVDWILPELRLVPTDFEYFPMESRAEMIGVGLGKKEEDGVIISNSVLRLLASGF